MFWDAGDLEELKGTAVVGLSNFSSIREPNPLIFLLNFGTDKLGREEANKDYQEQLLPAVQVRSSIFF
jgi:hypothetical protein